MASSPQKNLQFISPPKEAGDFLQNQVKLANGHLCTHLFTDWQKDCVVPYLVDTDPTNPKKVHRILLDIVQEGDTDEMD